jgi:hypothetical protein
MDERADQKFSKAIGLFIRASSGLAILLAFLVVIPLTLWFTWIRHSTIGEPVVLTLFCVSFAWGNISMLKWQRSLRRLGQSSSTRLLLSPRPEDPDELLVWQWGRQFCYSFLAVLVSMSAFGIIKWLNGE